jgi:hypothetical protein
MITLACGINATGESSENMKFLNYRKREGPRLGLLFNFGSAGALEGERRVRLVKPWWRLSSYLERNKGAR